MSKIKIIIQVIICIVFMFVLVQLNSSFEFLLIPAQKDIQEISYNFFTVNATMGGFAFTVLGMLYSFSSKEYIKALQGTNIIVNKASTIMQTIVFAGASGFINLFLIIASYKNWMRYLFILSVLFLFFSFAHFIKSIHCIYNLIRNIHKYDKLEISKKHQKSENTKSNNDIW